MRETSSAKDRSGCLMLFFFEVHEQQRKYWLAATSGRMGGLEPHDSCKISRFDHSQNIYAVYI